MDCLRWQFAIVGKRNQSNLWSSIQNGGPGLHLETSPPIGNQRQSVAKFWQCQKFRSKVRLLLWPTSTYQPIRIRHEMMQTKLNASHCQGFGSDHLARTISPLCHTNFFQTSVFIWNECILWWHVSIIRQVSNHKLFSSITNLSHIVYDKFSP